MGGPAIPIFGHGVILQTRPDLAVHANALQRNAQAPQMIHLRRLNALARWPQRHPLEMWNEKMRPGGWLEVHSGAGFKREGDDAEAPTGRCMRGADLMRLGLGQSGSEIFHLLDWYRGSIKVVDRRHFTKYAMVLTPGHATS